NVTSATGVFGAASSSTTFNPAANESAPELPSGASASTYSHIAGSAGYVWLASANVVNGDKADNLAIQSLDPDIPPAAFAFLYVQTGMDHDKDGAFIDAKGIATDGTALLLRTFHWDGGDVPPTDEQLQDI